MSKEGRLMLSSVQPLRWLEKRKHSKKKGHELATKKRKFHFQLMFCLCSHLSLMVEVHSINDLLLPVLHNFPNSASDHVTSGKRSDGKAVSFPCRVNRKIQNTLVFVIHKQGWLLTYRSLQLTHLSDWQSESISAAGFYQKHSPHRQGWTVWNLHCCFETGWKEGND